MLRSVNTRGELMVMKISLRLKKMKLDLRKSMVGPNMLLKLHLQRKEWKYCWLERRKLQLNLFSMQKIERGLKNFLNDRKQREFQL
jgi:hypothetical protein